MLVNLKKILIDAKKQHYAVGAFNTSNLEITQSILSAAEHLRAPVIIATSPKAIAYAGGAKVLADMIKALAKNYNVTYALHLDHAKDIKIVKECIMAGYPSVMFDGSRLSFKNNLSLTKQVVRLAHKHQASVEGEIGTIGGQEDYLRKKKIILADPKQAFIFVKKTGIDALAAAVGTAHGTSRQSGKEKINFKVLKEVAEAVKIPLVLHGASEGILPKDIKRAIKEGICKINIDTNLRRAFAETIRNFLKNDKSVYDPRVIMAAGTIAMERVVEVKIKLFGSQNKKVH